MRWPRTRNRHIETRVDIFAQEQLAPSRNRPVDLKATVDDLTLVLLDELSIRQNLAPITHPALTDMPANIERNLSRVGVAVVSKPL
jgi:hypothetical protein